MRIREITAKAFMCHTAMQVSFPSLGIVLVTGENGSGKSSILEGVATSCWGETLRGSSPWRSKEKGQVRVRLNTIGASFDITRKGNPSKLEWLEEGQPSPKYETPTKAQLALQKRIGSFDLWRRSHVFSSSDAALFSKATDSERKRLLEEALGLDVFDSALSECKADLLTAEGALHSATTAHSRLVAELEALHRQRQQWVNMCVIPPNVPRPTPPDVTGYNTRIKSWTTFQTELRDKRSDLQARLIEARTNLRNEKAAHDALAKGFCPTCSMPYPVSRTTEAAERLRHERDRLAKLEESSSEETADLDAAFEEQEESLRDLNAERDAIKMYPQLQQAWDAHDSADSYRSDNLAKTDALILGTEQALSVITAELAGRASSVAELKVCLLVLGMRGVRAQVLDNAVQALEQGACVWLSKLGMPGLSVRLSSSTEQANGKVVDKLSLAIDGIQHGEGYKGASAGERRRIDLGLQLSIADLVGFGQDDTLFFDESMDGLDVEGVGAAADCLKELARTRCVVVISHSQALAKQLSPSQCIQLARVSSRAA